jgi:hypothetical protein
VDKKNLQTEGKMNPLKDFLIGFAMSQSTET